MLGRWGSEEDSLESCEIFVVVDVVVVVVVFFTVKLGKSNIGFTFLQTSTVNPRKIIPSLSKLPNVLVCAVHFCLVGVRLFSCVLVKRDETIEILTIDFWRFLSNV